MAAELGQGGRTALVVARGTQQVIEDLQDSANVTAWTPTAVLTVWVKGA